jgi:hypothetical protein
MIVATWERNGVDSLLCILTPTAPLLICQLPYTESNSQLVVTSVVLAGQQGAYLLLAWQMPTVAWSTVCTGSQTLGITWYLLLALQTAPAMIAAYLVSRVMLPQTI